MIMTRWKHGDIAVDPMGRRWKVIAVDDGNIFEYPALQVELEGSVQANPDRIWKSSRMLKKETS